MQYGLLGELQVRHRGEDVLLGGRRNTALLGLLLVSANRAVSGTDIAGQLWGVDKGSASATLQSQVHRLRQRLPRTVIETTASGYRLVAQPDAIDARRFEATLAAARVAQASGSHEECLGLLEQALGLWRGPALVDLLHYDFAVVEHRQLEERRLEAGELHGQTLLDLGRAEQAVAVTERLVTDEPLRENRWALRMTALYRAGRQADALMAFRLARTHLRDELGVDPGPGLQRTHQQVLSHDNSLANARPALRTEPLHVRYARRADGVHLAYESFGAGRAMVLAVGTWSGLTVRQNPLSAAFAAELGTLARVICYDAQGLGLSDPLGEALPTIDDRVDELLTVAAKETDGPAVIYGFHDGAAVAIRAAATRPDIVAGLIIHNGFTHSRRRDGDDTGYDDQQIEAMLRSYEELHGLGCSIDLYAPSLADDPQAREWWADGERNAARRSEAVRVSAAAFALDVRDDLAHVRAPTLILHAVGNLAFPMAHARHIAAHIPRARLIELPGHDHALWFSRRVTIPMVSDFLRSLDDDRESSRRRP
jgi:DNA-binding SARP family transcriptional activator/pimeloyl-ACP methyl ester carboxylesterase